MSSRCVACAQRLATETGASRKEDKAVSNKSKADNAAVIERSCTLRDGERDRTPIEAWMKIVIHIYVNKHPKLKDAMTEASQIRKSVIAKKPHLEKDHMKLADATIKEFDRRTKKR